MRFYYIIVRSSYSSEGFDLYFTSKKKAQKQISKYKRSDIHYVIGDINYKDIEPTKKGILKALNSL
tara:strand:- start:217 stop:414 length:198 start_codon:yes stop_codon:yes gene_type:complete